MITPAQVLARFEYDRDNGRLISRFTGKPVGFLDRHGYLMVRIGDSNHLVHRMVWLIENGSLPQIVDHADRNTLNNHISNLRASDRATNAQNSKLRRDSATGVKGVSWDKRSGLWHAHVCAGGRRVLSIKTGNFEKAVIAAREAREKYHGEFCNHGDAP